MLSSAGIAAREQFANIDAKRIGYRDDRLDTGIFLAAFDPGQVPQRQFCLSSQRLLRPALTRSKREDVSAELSLPIHDAWVVATARR